MSGSRSQHAFGLNVLWSLVFFIVSSGSHKSGFPYPHGIMKCFSQLIPFSNCARHPTEPTTIQHVVTILMMSACLGSGSQSQLRSVSPWCVINTFRNVTVFVSFIPGLQFAFRFNDMILANSASFHTKCSCPLTSLL